MELDLRGFPAVDAHCHLFQVEPRDVDVAKTLSLSLEDMPRDQLENTLVYKAYLKEMARFLGTSGSPAEIMGARATRANGDYQRFVQDLFLDGGIEHLVVDLGYKPASVSLEAFEALVPAGISYVFRIEGVLDEGWNERKGFEETERALLDALEEARHQGVVAVKTIIGYRTGVGVRRTTRGEAKEAYDAGQPKPYRDYFFCLTLGKCLEYGLPLQVHASFGESNIDLLQNNPLLLKEVLDDPEFKKATIVMVHGGYPYSFEAGYLLAMYPNLYLDVSEMIPFVPLGAGRGIASLMDMAPLGKVMYGSDGFIIPDLHWYAAVTARRCLGRVLGEIVERGLLEEDEALAVARDVMAGTARRVFGLKDSKP
ncbi:MAG: amidohydrolase family protein [Bacillota bacterium]